MPNDENVPAAVLENVLVTIHDWWCEECSTMHRLLGVSCHFSDGMEAYGFCAPEDQMQFIDELVEAHGAVYAERERSKLE